MTAVAHISAMQASIARGSRMDTERMSIKGRIGIALLLVWVAYMWVFGPSPQPDINICSLEYRAAYMEINGNDAALRRECPFAPWVKASR